MGQAVETGEALETGQEVVALRCLSVEHRGTNQGTKEMAARDTHVLESAVRMARAVGSEMGLTTNSTHRPSLDSFTSSLVVLLEQVYIHVG